MLNINVKQQASISHVLFACWRTNSRKLQFGCDEYLENFPCFRLNLHCTFRRAALEEAFPRLLFATHRYSPSSAVLTFAMFNSLLSAPKLILESPLALMMDPSLVHDTVGTGSPLALQDKVTFSPSIFVAFCG